MRPTICLLLATATRSEDWVQRSSEQLEQAWPSALDRRLQATGACDADAALKTFQKCLKQQCPTIIDSKAATMYVFPAANETATTCQEARERDRRDGEPVERLRESAGVAFQQPSHHGRQPRLDGA